MFPNQYFSLVINLSVHSLVDSQLYLKYCLSVKYQWCNGLVLDNIVHLIHNLPPFGTWGSLTFDISIASYTITRLFISFLYYIIQVKLWMETKRGIPTPPVPPIPPPSDHYWQKRHPSNGSFHFLLRELIPYARDQKVHRSYV